MTISKLQITLHENLLIETKRTKNFFSTKESGSLLKDNSQYYHVITSNSL